MYKSILFTGSILLMTAMTGCQSPHPSTEVTRFMDDQLAELKKDPSVDDSNNKQKPELPPAVNAFLDDEDDQLAPSLFGRQKYDVNAQDVDMRAFFSGLVTDTPYSVAIHPEVEGTVSLTLKQVAMPDIVALVGELYDLDIERRGAVFRIQPQRMRTETIPVNYLLMTRNGFTQTSVISGGVSQMGGNNNMMANPNGQQLNNFSGNAMNNNNLGGMGGVGMGMNGGINGTMISTMNENNFWQNLEESLESMIGTSDGRAILVTPQAGLVTIKAMPDEIRAVKRFLSASESNLQRQVILEARIIEVTLSDGYQQGINWNQVIANVGSTDFNFGTSAGVIGNEVSAALGGVSSVSFVNQDFSGVLSLLSTQGNVQVLSSPRVTAINNQKAVIKVGEDEYFVTDVTSQNTITAAATSIVPDIELTPFFSGIALDVTPQIDENGSVLLHVHPSVIETQEQEKVVTLDQEQIVLPLAQSTIRESDTIIRANSGEIVVIGGLMQTTVTDSVSQTPLLGDIPVVGELFTNRRQLEQKKELVILLKPSVVDANTWKNQVEASRATMADWLFIE